MNGLKIFIEMRR